MLERYPELTPTDEVAAGWQGVSGAGSATCARPATTAAAGGCCTRSPARCPTRWRGSRSSGEDGRLLVPLTPTPRRRPAEQPSARLDAGAERALRWSSTARPAARRGWRGPRRRRRAASRSRCSGIPTSARRSSSCRAPSGTRAVTLDPWLAEELDAFVALHEVAGHRPRAATVLERAARRARAPPRRRSAARARPAPSRSPRSPASLGGELAPFQWAAVRYALEARRAFLADEQGLGKTVEALATLEADDAFPAVVVCPASLKLDWAARGRAVAAAPLGRGDRAAAAAVPPPADITILNYEIVAAHREALARRRPRALVVDESHYCKNPHAKRTQAVRRLAAAVPPDGLRLALTGTPVLNHADELIAQLRVIGRLRGLRLGRALRAPVPGRAAARSGCTGICAALLRAPAEVRGAAAAARPSARSWCRSR